MTEIRKAVDADVPVIVRLGFDEYMEALTYLLGLNFSFLVMMYSCRKLIENEHKGSVFVAEEDGKLVGFYSAEYVPSMLDFSQTIAMESSWYVLPEYRGRGIGKKLLKVTEQQAFAMGIRMKMVAHAVTTETGRSLGEWFQRMGYIPYEQKAFKMLTEEDFK